MPKFIVITSISNPTKAVHAFAKINDYSLIVVGDKRTPCNWEVPNVDFISIDKQEQSKLAIAKVLPYNHYARKMLGYIEAIKYNAEYIIDTDDDNLPKENWDFPGFDGTFASINTSGFINIYQYFTDQHIWPRGFPLKLITNKYNFKEHVTYKQCKIGVWQGLADNDPDVDAIYRLTDNGPCIFDDNGPIILSKGTICPFNSQNTIIRKELFPLLYLPAHVSFRFTDILRGLVAQPIMWLYDYHLGFTNATVTQDRNQHDYLDDFVSEIPMYRHTDKIISIIESKISRSKSIHDNLFSAYEALQKNQIVTSDEILTLEAWLSDMANALPCVSY